MNLPVRSELITTREEALAYYAAQLAGARSITCGGKPITIVFEPDGTHLFSEDPKDGQAIDPSDRIQRRVSGGRTEIRRFSLTRARLMDRICSTVEGFTVSIPGTGSSGHEKRMLHGPSLGDGYYLRVVLRPGPGHAWTVVSAYPVAHAVWMSARNAKRAKFPP